MSFRHDVERFWTGYHRMREALEAIDAMPEPSGSTARAAALQVLNGGSWPADLPPGILRPVMELFAGLDRAERSVCGPCSEGGNPGSPGDARTDADFLAELVSEWKRRLHR